jgi:hypothetical protein
MMLKNFKNFSTGQKLAVVAITLGYWCVSLGVDYVRQSYSDNTVVEVKQKR